MMIAATRQSEQTSYKGENKHGKIQSRGYRMGVKPSIFNLMNGPVPIVYTVHGPFILCHETLTAYNTRYIEADYTKYLDTFLALQYPSPFSSAVQAHATGRTVPCGEFTPIKTGRYTWHKDEKSGLVATPGARILFKEYAYSFWQDFLVIHTPGDNVVAVIYGKLEVMQNEM